VSAGGWDVRWDNAYSSLFLGGAGNGNEFRMDGEVLRTAFGARAGLGHGLDVELEVPLLHSSGGFLDDFVIEWHELWGLPDQGRDEAARDLFDVHATRQGASVYQMTEEGLELGDVPVALSWTFLPVPAAGGFGAGVRGGVELPAGDDAHGFGNGELDVALGAFAEYRAAEWGVTAHAGHTFAGSPDVARAGGLEFRDVTACGLGLELGLARGLVGVVQTELETSTLRGLGFDRVSDPQWFLWSGVRAALGERVALEAAIGEDLSAYVAPDFTVWLALRVELGSAASER
jgi:hypothetical protein